MSTREIARRTHGAVSHTTAHQVLRAASLPSWKVLEPVIAALGGDAGEYKELWMRARDEEERNDATNTKRVNYQEDVGPKLAVKLNLIRNYIAQAERGKAEEFATECLGQSLDIDLVAEIHYALSYGSSSIRQITDPLVDQYIKSGNPDEIGSADAAHHLGRICLDRQMPTRALDFTRRAVLINPHSYWNLSVHAEALMILGIYEESERFGAMAYDLQPSPRNFFYTPYADLLTIKRDFGRLEQLAKESYEELGGPTGYSVAPFAQCLMLCGKPDLAVSVLREGLKKENRYAHSRIEILTRLSNALNQAGHLAEAMSALKSDPLYETSETLQHQHEYLRSQSESMSAESSIKILEDVVNIERS
ncbi:hypothetical protein [Streptomyces lonarensis]|nr:hypothetical protein [Streptomyces lonarensis]